ncbi:stress responsive protein [Amylibacter kogurei]|uniref:Stress responsive protein n=1 Tax=Paramylibacter kogurei TaxID=1889778 RepID=A0A2G5K478_9RHOB|nr:Dabb family protein [Amylibacter kogurei]PIB24225.1 stress responsive protein [Amylibacter kogurei]
MIRHIVFFNARDKSDLETIYNGLSLLKTNPHATHLEIGRNNHVDELSGDAVDFVVYGEFSDDAALAAYKAHHTYQDAIDIVRPFRDLRMAADFIAA